MEDIQMRAKTEEYSELNEWPWYVDGSVLECERNKAEPIQDHLNSIEPEHIVFTKEEKEDKTSSTGPWLECQKEEREN